MLTATEARLAALLTAQGAEGGLTAGQTLTSLGLDSVAMVEVIFAAEEEFAVAVPLDTQISGLTLGALAALIDALGTASP